MKKSILIVILLMTTFYTQLIAQFPQNSQQNGFNKIEADYINGVLNKEEMILNQFRYGFDQTKLDDKYKDLTTEKCATHLIKEYQHLRENFSQSSIDEIDSYLNKNSLNKTNAEIFTSPSGIFEITYETTGPNAIPDTDNDNSGIPDYAEETAEYFDFSWAHMIDTLGFDAPPLQNNVYQIGFEDMGFYGYTTFVSGGFTRIVMNISYTGFPPNTDPAGNEIGAAKVTAYHEFKHAVQFGYNNWGSGTSNWFVEMDATWSEDIGYNYVNDYYNYLGSSQIVNPGRALDASAGYEDCLFLHYFTQKFGNDFAVDLWASIRDNSFNSEFNHLKYVLENSYSSNLQSEMPGYYLWNAMSGNNVVPGVTTYVEASDYPTSDLCVSTNNFPTTIDGCSIVETGSNIIKLNGSVSDDFFSYEIMTGNTDFVVASVFEYLDGDPEVYYHSPDTEGPIFRVNQQMNNIDKVFLIPIVNTFSNGDYEYSLDLKAFKNAEFVHTPLTDQESDQNLIINVTVETPFNIALKDSLRLHYSDDNTFFSSTTMIATANENEFTATIPPFGLEKTISYYFSIADTAGNYLYLPEDAPTNSFSFFVGVDSTPPVINVSPIVASLSKFNFPYQLTLTASDNIALKEIIVEYKINGGSLSTQSFMGLNDSLFIGSLDLSSDDLQTGDAVEFRIIAEDDAQITNISTFPETGFEMISIVDGFNFTSEANKFIEDNTFPAVRDTITIAENLTIEDVDIYIEGIHSRFSDWEIKLRTPQTSTKNLAKRPGLETVFEDAANPKLLFDQQAYFEITEPFYINPAVAEGVFRPEDVNLDDFIGVSAQGNWILSITDKLTGNVGRLNSWSLIIRGEIITSVNTEVDALPTKYSLSQNYPNPFNPSTTIAYSIPVVDVPSLPGRQTGGVEGPNVTIRIYDTLGRVVATLVNKAQSPGNYSVQWDASNYASGLYFYKLIHGTRQITKKMLMIK